MELNEYQQKAMTTCLPTCDNHAYMILNLMAELGEFAGKIAKGVRKGEYNVNDNNIEYAEGASDEEIGRRVDGEKEIQKELGDCLWQLSGVCSSFGWSLEDIADINLEKLKSRKERGVIDGNGDNR